MASTPLSIRAHRQEGILELCWETGTTFRLPFKYVRGECPCASCIEEWTGRRILNLDTIPDTIVPTEIRPVGNYALKITWSDGHNTGLYTWDHLRTLCDRHSQPEQQQQ